MKITEIVMCIYLMLNPVFCLPTEKMYFDGIANEWKPCSLCYLATERGIAQLCAQKCNDTLSDSHGQRQPKICDRKTQYFDDVTRRCSSCVKLCHIHWQKTDNTCVTFCPYYIKGAARSSPVARISTEDTISSICDRKTQYFDDVIGRCSSCAKLCHIHKTDSTCDMFCPNYIEGATGSEPRDKNDHQSWKKTLVITVPIVFAVGVIISFLCYRHNRKFRKWIQHRFVKLCCRPRYPETVQDGTVNGHGFSCTRDPEEVRRTFNEHPVEDDAAVDMSNQAFPSTQPLLHPVQEGEEPPGCRTETSAKVVSCDSNENMQ